MTCNGWFIDNEFIPFADSRQGQANGVATLNEDATAVVQDTEPPSMYATSTLWEEGSSYSIAQYVCRLLTNYD